MRRKTKQLLLATQIWQVAKYIFYEEWLFTAKCGMELPPFQKVVDAVRELFDKVSEMRDRYRYDIRYKETMGWIERISFITTPTLLRAGKTG